MAQGEHVATLDERTSVIWAQVRSAKDDFAIEEDGEGGILRPARHPGASGSIILGDVMTMLMRVFGAHAPPRLKELPGFDEQRWTIEFGDSVMRIKVESRPYWGFGLLATSFLNRIEIVGPMDKRCRLILDLASALGRPPWEPMRRRRWEKVTGLDNEEHRRQWNLHMNSCRSNLKLEIEKRRMRLEEVRRELELEGEENRDMISSLQRVERDLDVSMKALHEDNAAAVERALARMDTVFIELDPEAEIKPEIFNEEEDELILHAVSAEEIDLDEKMASSPVLDMEHVIGKVDDDLPMETEVEASELLNEEDDVPFVDLSSEE